MLIIKNISKKFNSDQVLKNISLELNSGEIMVLLGKSGSGKSTLLKCINQLETANEGKIYINDLCFDFSQKQKFTNKQIKQLRQNVGIVFQQFCLWPHLTVLQNITLAPKKLGLMNHQEAKRQAIDLLERFELVEKADVMPSALSGGQQQRISIARSLILKPKLLLFDEPTSALDPEMTQAVSQIIKKLKNDGIAMLISSHEIDFAKTVADKFSFLHQGSIIESGNVQGINQPKTEAFKKFLAHYCN